MEISCTRGACPLWRTIRSRRSGLEKANISLVCSTACTEQTNVAGFFNQRQRRRVYVDATATPNGRIVCSSNGSRYRSKGLCLEFNVVFSLWEKCLVNKYVFPNRNAINLFLTIFKSLISLKPGPHIGTVPFGITVYPFCILRFAALSEASSVISASRSAAFNRNFPRQNVP